MSTSAYFVGRPSNTQASPGSAEDDGGNLSHVHTANAHSGAAQFQRKQPTQLDSTSCVTGSTSTLSVQDDQPVPETILFETGNEETGFVIRGSINIGPLSTFPSEVLSVESVPGLMTSADFCKFVLPFLDSIVHMRTLRSVTERNRYMVVIKFRKASVAQMFANQFRGKLYLRGISQEKCVIRSVNSIHFERANSHSTEGTVTDSNSARNSDSGQSVPSSNSKSRVGDHSKHKKMCFPYDAMFPADGEDSKLQPSPNCAICLERLDCMVSALVTNFCNHTLHAACLAKCDANCCPVCRHAFELTPESSVCMKCGQHDGLWMCIVCAFVGCGYYREKHALDHFRETQHPFASSLTENTFWSGETLRAGVVWDYTSERFVNRLVTSDDGKVVEVDGGPAGTEQTELNSSASARNDDACCAGGQVDVMVEDAGNDRAFQAAIYASRMDVAVDEYRSRIAMMEAEHEAERERMEAETRKLRRALSAGAKERKSFVKRIAEAEKEVQTLRDKNGFLKTLNETLLRDKKAWNEEVENLKEQIERLKEDKKACEEQLRDLMLHLETQSKIVEAASGSTGDSCRSGVAELQGADVVRVGPSRQERLSLKGNRRVSGN